MARDNFSPSQQIQAARQAVAEFASDPLNPIYIAAQQFLAQQGVAASAGVQGGTVVVAQERAAQAAPLPGQARSIAQQFTRPPRDAQEAATRVRALSRGRDALLANPNIPQYLKDEVEALLGEAEAAQEALSSQRSENLEFGQGVVGADDTVDLVAGRPISEATRLQVPTVGEYNAAGASPVPQGIAATTAEGVPLSLAPPVDPRGTVDAQTVAGTPRARRGAAPAAAPTGPQAKVEGPEFPDPYDPRGMYASTGPFDEMRDTFQQEGKIKQEAGLQGAADVMAAAEEIKALRSQAFQRMGEDFVAQEQRLRELDLQLSSLREMRFDSDRLFRNRGHGVSLALGMAVGAMQQTISNILYPGANVPNTAMQLVQDAIDRDLREQAVDYQRAQTEIGMGRTAYEMARQMGMDHTAAYEYARAGAQEYVASQLQATRMRMGAGVAAEQMHRAEQELRLQAMDRKNMALMAMAEAQAPRVAGRGTGTQATTFSPLVAYAPGVTAKMVQDQLGATTVAHIRTSMEGAASVIRITDELRRLVMETGGGQNWATRVGGRIRSLASQLKNAIRQSSGMGALDEGALKMTRDIAGDPVAFTESMQTYLGRLEALRSEVMAKAQEMARYSGGGLLRFDESLRSQPSPTPPGVEFTDEEQPASGRQGPASTAAQAVADNPIGTAATIIGGTGVLGQATEEGLRDILE